MPLDRQPDRTDGLCCSAPLGSLATKAAAIGAYDSQSGLLGGELRYVWGKGVELYWPMKGDGSTDV